MTTHDKQPVSLATRRTGRMKHHYSGDDSKPFWARVNNPKLSDDDHTRLYAAGVLLQEMESRILNWLENAEESAGYKQQKKRRTS